ncbi:GNAT family N-acetyltransferase [Phenylobacterium sp.]|jgi:GNAT superfamily N-acetyltransferase|uniref:GNAT family N-acetyltransferase n=1 Tax=Phenylobacterium sp. TaxID=1871053 RepID=UPI002E363703|nr:GNAT family N-acetyltransferase [Phenylobacterium sp.]HEX4711843.1 GNAT family N-acetyltransferase [Phenylobacterium sp.]
MKAEALAIRPAGTSPAQLAAYSGLLNTAFPAGKFTPEALAWRYRDNPAGVVIGCDAWDGDRLAAHYVTCPLEARIEGATVRGLLSLNTATHPDYQGRGLFTRLAEAAYGQGADAGFDFVIGIANANSTPGFLRKLAFQDVGRLHAGLLARTPRAFSGAPVQYQGAWREDLLSWRLANPLGRYVTARRGDLLGVWAKTHLPFVRCAAFLPAVGEAPARRNFGPPAATLFMGLEPRMALGQQGFLPLPERLRPSPLNLIWRRLGPDAPPALRRDAVAINFLDFDPY